MKSLKVNLSYDDWSFQNGIGEGVWVQMSDEEHEMLVRGKVAYATLDNDSMYYPGLKCGDRIQVETRGGQRPVALYKELVERFGPSRREEVLRFVANNISREQTEGDT